METIILIVIKNELTLSGENNIFLQIKYFYGVVVVSWISIFELFIEI